MANEEDYISLSTIKGILFGGKNLTISESALGKIRECYDFLDRFSHERIIYGINTGFGPMAQYRVSEEDRTALQYNIIRSHATGAGEPLPNIYVKAAMIARLGTFLQAQSGVHPDVVTLLLAFINNNIIPFIPEHGSVGASGDLVQLAHLALTLIGEGKVNYQGQWQPSAGVLKANNIKPFEIHIREGLSITNGTSFMTGIGLVNLFDAQRLLHWALTASVLVNEIVASFDDLMNETLNGVRRQSGQQRVAAMMRDIAAGSQCMLKRENELYKHVDDKVFKHKVQPYYSLRCIPQILGPVLEVIDNTARVLENEVNSACDNPIVDPETQNVYHGGNFHGDYVSFEMDKLKIAITKLTMTMERQMNYLFHDRINEGILPPFVNLGKLGLNYGLQACQFTATSTTAECQTLSNPMYVHSIPNNNDNQDVVSMGTNSALLAKRVINNAYQVMAIHYMAMAQAVDYLKIQGKLAPATRKVYDQVREIFPVFTEDYPLYTSVEAVQNYLKNAEI